MIRDIAGMKVIESPFLEPGTVLVVDPAVLDLSIRPSLEFDFYPKPYDKTKVPEGHVPKMLISDSLPLNYCDRVDFNNWLIDFFGTKPDLSKFRPMFAPIRNPIPFIGFIDNA